jgi:hypothetical protein
VRYKILKIDAPTPRGRIYPKAVIEEAIRKIDRPFIGQLDADPSGKLDLSKASHIAKHFRIEDGYLTAEIEILKTSPGQQLQKVLDQVVFRPSGEGHVVDEAVTPQVIYGYSISAVNALYKKDAGEA